jgi:ABC-type proline/glycine betaine transport system permease subunit
VSAHQGRLVGVTDPAWALTALLVPVISLSLVNWLIRLVLFD